MRHIRHPLVPALAAVAVLAGCATADTRRAAYEQALSRWQGASEADLVARWGPPVSVQAEGQAKWLTFVSRAAASTPTTTVAFSFGGFDFLHEAERHLLSLLPSLSFGGVSFVSSE